MKNNGTSGLIFKSFLAGMGFCWLSYQIGELKSINSDSQINPKQKIEIELDSFKIQNEKVKPWNGKKQNFELGNKITIYNKQNEKMLTAKYYGYENREIKPISESAQKLTIKQIDSLYRLMKEKIEEKDWIKNYTKNKTQWERKYHQTADTLIRNEFGTIYFLKDLNSDSIPDLIGSFGNTYLTTFKYHRFYDSTHFKDTYKQIMKEDFNKRRK